MHAPVEPSVSKTAFSCPHCGAFTTQNWFPLRKDYFDGDRKKPLIPNDAIVEKIKSWKPDDENEKSKTLAWAEAHLTGLPFFHSEDKSHSLYETVCNLHLSQCHHCNKLAIWLHERLLFPENKAGALPNPDLPEDIIRDFEEARSIVNSSPRGATALLRLCIQKLCSHLLGSKSKDINSDIGELVKGGLNPIVQRSLDVVRVIGNESVHPGTMDLKDDRDTAIALFGLVNSIADQLITHPKHVESLYNSLPPGKLQGIEARDKSSKQPPTP